MPIETFEHETVLITKLDRSDREEIQINVEDQGRPGVEGVIDMSFILSRTNAHDLFVALAFYLDIEVEGIN